MLFTFSAFRVFSKKLWLKGRRSPDLNTSANCRCFRIILWEWKYLFCCWFEQHQILCHVKSGRVRLLIWILFKVVSSRIQSCTCWLIVKASCIITILLLMFGWSNLAWSQIKANCLVIWNKWIIIRRQNLFESNFFFFALNIILI